MSSLIIDQVGCARCDGEGHPGMRFEPFQRPIVIDASLSFTHWALCPVTEEPILLVTLDAMGAPLPSSQARAASLPPDGTEAPEQGVREALAAFGWKGPHEVDGPRPDDEDD